jgi:hypothetical protein
MITRRHLFETRSPRQRQEEAACTECAEAIDGEADKGVEGEVTTRPRRAGGTIAMPPYDASFPEESQARIADTPALEQFLKTWKYRNKLKPEQLAFAGKTATVAKISSYHGGDLLYRLEGITRRVARAVPDPSVAKLAKYVSAQTRSRILRDLREQCPQSTRPDLRDRHATKALSSSLDHVYARLPHTL